MDQVMIKGNSEKVSSLKVIVVLGRSHKLFKARKSEIQPNLIFQMVSIKYISLPNSVNQITALQPSTEIIYYIPLTKKKPERNI